MSQCTGFEAQLCHRLAHDLGASMYLLRHQCLHLLKNGDSGDGPGLFSNSKRALQSAHNKISTVRCATEHR